MPIDEGKELFLVKFNQKRRRYLSVFFTFYSLDVIMVMPIIDAYFFI